ncbi:MAG: hypothetical protein HZA46_11535 [Planctomycetales bacterium]|nr:hypothetical protein [Planctomycetales bacterium]
MPLDSPSTIHHPPSTPFAPAILIFEKRQRWGTELKRELTDHRIHVRTHTSAGELPAALLKFPSSVVVLDLASDPAACLGVLGRVRELNLHARFLAIVPRSLADLEWPLREFGVEALTPDTIRGEELTKLCLRRLGDETRRRGDTETRGKVFSVSPRLPLSASAT